MDYVYNNSFRKVKLRETQSGQAKTVVPALTFLQLFPQSILPVDKESYNLLLCQYSRQLKLNSEFYKKKELEEISIYSFKPIRSTESSKSVHLPFILKITASAFQGEIKKNGIGVSQISKILIDATIPFQIKPWEYED